MAVARGGYCIASLSAPSDIAGARQALGPTLSLAGAEGPVLIATDPSGYLPVRGLFGSDGLLVVILRTDGPDPVAELAVDEAARAGLAVRGEKVRVRRSLLRRSRSDARAERRTPSQIT
ncbi:MAG: hypothetical protein ACO4CZ_12260 [Planctomycetota bacterium]